MSLNASSLNTATFDGAGESVVRASAFTSQVQGAASSCALAISCSGASHQAQQSDGAATRFRDCASGSAQIQFVAAATDRSSYFTIEDGLTQSASGTFVPTRYLSSASAQIQGAETSSGRHWIAVAALAQAQSSQGFTGRNISCSVASGQGQNSAAVLQTTMSFTTTAATLILQLPTGGLNYGGLGMGTFNGVTNRTNFTVAINSVSQTQTFGGYAAQFVGGELATDQCASVDGVFSREIIASCSSSQVQGLDAAFERAYLVSSGAGQVQGSDVTASRLFESSIGSAQSQTVSVLIDRKSYFSSEDGIVQSALGTMPRTVLCVIETAQAGQSAAGALELDVQMAVATEQAQTGIGNTQRDLSCAPASGQTQSLDAAASRLVEGSLQFSQAQSNADAMLRTALGSVAGAQTQASGGAAWLSVIVDEWATQQSQFVDGLTKRDAQLKNESGMTQCALGTVTRTTLGSVHAAQNQSAAGAAQLDVSSAVSTEQSQGLAGETRRDLSSKSASAQTHSLSAAFSRLVTGEEASHQTQTNEGALLRTMRIAAAGSQILTISGSTSRGIVAGDWTTGQAQTARGAIQRNVYFTDQDGISQSLSGVFSLLVEGRIVTVQSAQSAFGLARRELVSTMLSQQAQIQEGSVLLLSGAPSIFIAYVAAQDKLAIVPVQAHEAVV